LALDGEIAASLAQKILYALKVALEVGVFWLLKLHILVNLAESSCSQLVKL
jgi:hypothetical protein